MHLDTVVTTESLAWLLDYTDENPDQPWFFCASYYRPHFPLTAPGRYIRKYARRGLKRFPVPPGYPDALHPHDRYIVDDYNLVRFSDEEHAKALSAYYALVEYVDAQVGRLLAGLREAGLLENTLVIYTADHGDMAGEHGLWWKRTYYDASAGVPFLISGPGIAAGQRLATPVELVDLFPTFCDWAGIDAPPGIDGESLLPLVRGEAQRRRKRTAISELLGEKPPVRFRMARDERWKVVTFPNDPPRLFDLQNDPGETVDLWPSAPADAPVAALQALLPEDWPTLAQRRDAQYAAQPPFQRSSRSTAHYHLRDGRIIEADDHLYDASTVGSES